MRYPRCIDYHALAIDNPGFDPWEYDAAQWQADDDRGLTQWEAVAAVLAAQPDDDAHVS